MSTVLEGTRIRWPLTATAEKGSARRHLPATPITFLSLFASFFIPRPTRFSTCRSLVRRTFAAEAKS